MSTPIAWDDPFRVNAKALRKQFDSDLAGLANGGFISVWTDNSRTGADVSGSAVRAQIIDAFGHRTGAEFLVNTSTKASQFAPCITALSGGRVVVLWKDAVDPVGKVAGFIRGQIFNADGSKAGNEFVVHTSLSYIDKVTHAGESVTHSVGNVVALPNGGFAVLSFEGFYNDFDWAVSTLTEVITFYSANGTEVASTSGRLTGTTFSSGHSEMEVLRNGRVVVVTHTVPEFGDERSSVRIYSANGTPLFSADITSAAAGRRLDEVCPLATNGFMVLWTESETSPDSTIVGQIYSNGGAAIGTEFQVADLGSSPDEIVASALPDGTVIVIWLDDGNVMGQLLNADGSKSGDQFTIHGLGLAGTATVSALADGRFVVSWDQANLAHTDSEVFAQIYDSRLGPIDLNGTAQNDSFVGTAFDDTILGSFGHDTIAGGAGNDRLYGENGNDSISGGEGHDTLSGNSGNDRLNGGAGNDTMSGSSGNDLYTVDSDGDVVIEFADQGSTAFAARSTTT
jgi:hemolysin type calcium-binding protein